MEPGRVPFEFRPLEIPDVILVEPKAFGDGRGFFMETYKASAFEAGGIRRPFVQDNYSRSGRGVLRGLHYQKEPAAQAKLVSVVRGEIFDVAVDIRAGSPTYGRWVGQTLSEQNRRMLYVPRGFAHGFCVTGEGADVHYKADNEYSPEHDRGIAWNDPEIGIRWPVSEPELSGKDRGHPGLAGADNEFRYAPAGGLAGRIIKEIDGVVKGDHARWRVGIAKDPERRRKELGEPSTWRAWDAGTEDQARAIEWHFLDRRMRSDPGGGAGSRHVYVF